MKQIMIVLGLVCVLAFVPAGAGGAPQDDVTVTAGEDVGLDLQAVAELFRESEDLASFEKALNDPEQGVNNVDLDENGEVDFLRVMEEGTGDTRVIVLQASLGEDDYQDVAFIEVEKTGEDAVAMQIRGDEDLYGPDYYIVPADTRIHTWPVIVRIYGPGYRPYRSAYVWGAWPRWWKPWKPVKVVHYRSRVVRYHKHKRFVVVRKPHVVTVHKVKYAPRKSVRVVRKPAARRAKPARVRVRK